jgi:cyanoexosortase A
MKVNSLSAIKPLKNIQFWLLGIGAGLIAIILTLSWRSGDPSHVGMSALFFLAVASMLGDKQKSLIGESEIFSSGLGALLIAFVLWQSATLTNDNKFLSIFTHISPFTSALGLALIASGLKGLKQYWQELTILFFLGIPKVILTSVTDISPLTAKFSAFLLWYAGLEVNLTQDVYINLPTGSVKVYTGCSGAELISHLLGIAVICLLMFPIQRKKRFLVPITAVIFAFVVNGIRVAILALLTAQGNKQAFNYWHEGDGSRLFGMIAVLILCLFYVFLLKQEESKKAGIRES